MKFIVVLFLLTVVSTNLFAKTLEIEFSYEGLNLSDLKARFQLESTAKYCQKIYINPANGIAIVNRYKDYIGKIVDLGNNFAKVVVEYEDGGFCGYQLYQVNFDFISGKKYLHRTAFSVDNEKDWSPTGHLEDLELLKNSGRKAVNVCKEESSRGSEYKFTRCYGYVDGVRESVGQPVSFYIWREYMTGTDFIRNVHLSRQ